MESIWKSRAVLVFFILAFGIRWVGWTLLAVLYPPHHTALWWLLFLTGIQRTDAQDPYDIITMAIVTAIVGVLFMPSPRRHRSERAAVGTS